MGLVLLEGRRQRLDLEVFVYLPWDEVKFRFILAFSASLFK